MIRPVVKPGLAGLRRVLPLRLPRWLRRVGASAATLNTTVVSAAAIRSCHALGVAVYVWTVDDPALAERLSSLGADGIITNDPRIFGRPLHT
jgi:glycerophosphoryl diester phosphodiesterase